MYNSSALQNHFMTTMIFAAFIVVFCYVTLTIGLTPPTIVEFQPNNYDDPDQAVAGRKFVITCKATGSLPMTFAWTKNDVAFTSYKPYKVIATSGHISNVTIKSLNPDEDGKYQCFVSNAAGTTFSRKLRLKVTYTSPFVKDTTDTEEVNVTVGKPLHVKCPPQDKSDGHEDFGSIHTWGRKKKLVQLTLQQKANRAIMKNGDLYFTYVDQKDIDEIKQFPDEGIQCFVKAGNAIYRSLVYKLKVNPVKYNTTFAPEFAPSGEPKAYQSAVQGKKKFLHCIASGKPAPTVKWMRVLENGKVKPIQNEKDGFLISEAQLGRVLYIPKVNKEQHEPGYYKCEVSNSAGKVTSKLIKLHVFVPPVWDVKPPSIKTVPVLGDSEVVCTAFGSPSPEYKWYYNGREITSNKELSPQIIVKGGRLLINKVLIQNKGLYQCALENNWGMVVSSTWLRIKVRPPRIENFGPFYIFRGTKAMLACDSNAAPLAQHTWSKNGQLIAISGRYSLDAVNSLVLANVTSDDEGTYTCKATNDFGNDTASNNATVYDRTEIVKRPNDSMFIRMQKVFHLHCEARTDQRLKSHLKYKWLKDGAIIKYDKRVRWIENQNILKIKDADLNDRAMYTCVAYTDAAQRSEDKAAAVVDIKGVPFPPSNLTITGCHNRTTTISWKKGKDNDAPVTHFVVEQESTYAPEEWHVIINITDPMLTSYKFKLTAWANLTFRMRAINKIGPSRASLPTPKGKCVTSRFRPIMYPRNLKGVHKKDFALDITWTPMTKLEANGPGLHYILKYKRSKSKYWRPDVILKQNEDHYSIPHAGNYVLWEFQISAKNDVGEGPISDIVRSFSGQDAPKDAPKNVRKGKITARSIELSWDSVFDANGIIDGYHIYYWASQSNSISAQRHSKKVISTSNGRQKQNLTGLTPNTTYSLVLEAFNSRGEGPQSEVITFNTLEDGSPSFIYPPKNKTVAKGEQIRLICNATGHPTPNISWSKAGGTIKTGYVFGKILVIPYANQSDAGRYICTAKNAYGGQVYRTSVEVFVTVKLRPHSPVPSSTQITDLSIKVHWKKPESHGYPVLMYSVHRVDLDEAGQEVTSRAYHVNEDVHQYEVGDIVRGKSYKFYVTAWNTHGESVKDHSKSITVNVQQP